MQWLEDGKYIQHAAKQIATKYNELIYTYLVIFCTIH